MNILQLVAVEKADIDLSSHGTQPKCGARCGDGRVYVIKVPHAAANRNEFIGEVVGSVTLDEVGIGTPDCAVVDVPEGLLTTHLGSVPAGTYFGSLFDEQRKPLSRDVVVDAAMANALYPLLAVDLLILNVDRKPGDVLHFPGDSSLRKGFLAIDHSNAFSGGNWTVEHLKKLNASTETIEPRLGTWLFRTLLDESNARDAAAAIAGQVSDVVKLLNRAANVLTLDNDTREALLAFLNTRLASLVDLAVRQIARSLEYARERERDA